MKQARAHHHQGWIFLWVWLLAIIYYTTPRAADSHVLRDVSMVHQDDRWHVVLIGSDSMSYNATKVFDPLRVIVDLPNTLCRTMIISPIRGQGIINRVRISVVSHDPEPSSRVEIDLNQDTSYEINQVQEKVWVSFDAAPDKSKAEPAAVEPSAKELQTAMREPLSLASKILAIEPVTTEEDCDVHIIGDGRLENYNVSLLSDHPRLVLDLIDITSAWGKDDITLNGPWVRRIRVGLHADKARIVFDLSFIPQRELPYHIILEKNRMVVSFQPNPGFPPR